MYIWILIIMALVTVVLLAGISTMTFANEIVNKKYSTKFMIARVSLQALVVFSLLFFYFTHI
jgi:hypothetical protein